MRGAGQLCDRIHDGQRSAGQSIASGAAAPSTPYSQETLKTTGTIGGVDAPQLFAGMSPTFVGLMQVSLQIPAVSGDLPVRVQIGSFPSNSALVCVH
ncbi:MAG: hypothetical protein WDO73_26025 [Ignavibacteriota bacterium]